MDYRLLGRSGLQVSSLTMGTMTLGGGSPARWASSGWHARRQIDLCLDAGVNLIDTADVYSERRLGGDRRRGPRGRSATGVLLATKARFRWATGPTTRAPPATT